MPDPALTSASDGMAEALARLALIEGDIATLLTDAHRRAGELYGLTKAAAVWPRPERAPGIEQLLREMEETAEGIATIPKQIRLRLARLQAARAPAAQPAPPPDNSFRARHRADERT
jgi:hypothetical protein